jgi:hypothetical protein
MGKWKRFSHLKDHATMEEVEWRKFVIVSVLLTHLNFLIVSFSNLDLSFCEVLIWGPYLNMTYFAI